MVACPPTWRVIESGPATGVLMCAAAGQIEGFTHVLTFDMGGTTAKLGAVDKGEPVITTHSKSIISISASTAAYL
jgi:N-methylhydantoinase A/oxoprolinase/acetone carboxylase beta subunit